MGNFIDKIVSNKIVTVIVILILIKTFFETFGILAIYAFVIWFLYFNITWIKKHREKYRKAKSLKNKTGQ
ncbi:MAG: hypothetical protein ABIF85_04655 [Nanoarchaeota archaeon]